MIEFINQAVIAVLGIGAAWCLTEPSPLVRYWGCWLGLISEPFWLYESWRTGTWGIAILCVMYSIAV